MIFKRWYFHNNNNYMSGFCHFGLMSFMGFVTEPWHYCHVMFSRERAGFERAQMPCFVLERGVQIPGTHVLSFGFLSGFVHSRSAFCLIVWVCGREFAPATCSSVHVCCVLCCTQFMFYRLRAFLLCLVLCGTQLVYFIGCVFSCCPVLCEHVAYEYSH